MSVLLVLGPDRLLTEVLVVVVVVVALPPTTIMLSGVLGMRNGAASTPFLVESLCGRTLQLGGRQRQIELFYAAEIGAANDMYTLLLLVKTLANVERLANLLTISSL